MEVYQVLSIDLFTAPFRRCRAGEARLSGRRAARFVDAEYTKKCVRAAKTITLGATSIAGTAARCWECPSLSSKNLKAFMGQNPSQAPTNAKTHCHLILLCSERVFQIPPTGNIGACCWHMSTFKRWLSASGDKLRTRQPFPNSIKEANPWTRILFV